MKRYISLFCVALLVVASIVSPVQASSIDAVPSNYIDLLDYYTVRNSGSNFFSFSGSADNFIDLPSSFYSNYVDILFSVNGPALSAFEIYWNSSKYNLNIESCGNGFYRAYGAIRIDSYSRVYFSTSNTSGTSYVQLWSFKMFSPGTSSESECYCAIGTVDYDRTIHYVPGDEINYRTFTGTTDYQLAGYTLNIYNLDWKKYDYIDYYLYTTVDSITSVSCTIGDKTVPFEISYIDNDSMTSNDFCYSITVDCTGLDRSVDDYPLIVVYGNVVTNGVNMISMLGCRGYVSLNTIDPQVHFLSKIKTSLDNILSSISSNFSNLNAWIITQTNSISTSFSTLRSEITTHFSNLNSWITAQTTILERAIRGDTAPGNSFQDQVSQKDQQLNDMAAVMDSVERPNINSVNVSPQNYVDGTVLAASMSGITSVIGAPVFLDVIMMSLIMATAGYVLFGKR